MKPNFAIVWNRIVACEGEVFAKNRGAEFTYTVNGENLVLHGTHEYPMKDFNFSKTSLQAGLDYMPCDGPGDMPKDVVFNRSHVWAILRDDRIKQKDW